MCIFLHISNQYGVLQQCESVELVTVEYFNPELHTITHNNLGKST